MNKEQLFVLHEDICYDARQILKKKCFDYTQNDEENPFSNFQASEIIGLPPEMGVLLRVLDKIKRIETHIKTGKLTSESLLDAIQDNINYHVILYAMLKERKEDKKS